jgi:hypothetical protein
MAPFKIIVLNHLGIFCSALELDLFAPMRKGGFRRLLFLTFYIQYIKLDPFTMPGWRGFLINGMSGLQNIFGSSS